MRHSHAAAIVSALFTLLLLPTWTRAAEQPPTPIDQAIEKHWTLQGNVPIDSIQEVLRSFAPRIQTIILDEAREYSRDLPILKTSMDDNSFVFSSQKPVSFTIQAGDRPQKSQLKLRVDPYITRYVPRLLDKADNIPPLYTTQLEVGPDASQPIMLSIQTPGVYKLSLTLSTADGAATGHRELFFAIGYDRPLTPQVSFTPEIPTTRPLFTQYYPLKAPAPPADLTSVGLSLDPEIDFPLIKKIGYDGIHVIIHWDDLEPIPNAFDFQALDRCIELAGKFGLVVEIFPMYQAHRQPYSLWTQRMVDQDGNVSTKEGGRFVFVAPMEDQEFRRAYAQLMQKIITRYDKIPYVLGYHLSLRNVEWAYPGAIGNKQVFDYSPAATQGFRDYLKVTQHWSLDAVNKRYGTQFQSWQELTLPRPTFGQPDTRHWWWDFIAYKKWVLRDNARQVLSSVRELTSKKLVFYNVGGFGPIENLLPVFKQFGAYGGICSSQVFYTPMVYDLYRNAGLPLYTESAGFEKDSIGRFYYNLLTGRRVIDEVGGIPNFPDMAKTVALKERFDEQSHDILPLVYNRQPRTYADVALYYSYDSAIDSSKSIDLNTWNWFRLFAPLVQAASYSARPISYATDAASIQLNPSGLLIDTGSTLLNQNSVEQLLAYADQGGTLALFTNTGQYLIGRDGNQWTMFKALGLTPRGNIAPLKSAGTIDWGHDRAVTMQQVQQLVNLPESWRTIATDGQAVVAASRAWGKGQIIVMAGRPQTGWQNLSTWLDALADAANCPPRLLTPLTSHKVSAMTIQHDDKVFLVLQNGEDQPVTVKYRCNPGLIPNIDKSFEVEQLIEAGQVRTFPLVAP